MKIGNSVETQKLDIPRHTDNRAGAVAKPSVSSDEPVSAVARVDKTTDRVELSQTSQAARQDTAPVRADKVAQVRAAIERGEFPVNPAKVAERMISEAVELVNLIVPAAQPAGDDAAQRRDAAGAVGRIDGRDT